MARGGVRKAVSPRLIESEYDAFLALVGDDPEFPANHMQWGERMSNEDAKRRADGFVVQEVVVHAEEFAHWCEGSGVDPGFNTLCAFAVAKGRGNR